MSALTTPLLGSPLLKALEPLALLRGSRAGKRGTQQMARLAGGTREFLDHRKFQPGDDPRGVNWQAYLRSEQLVVKLFQNDGHLPTRILLDCSRSMLIGSGAGEETKFAYAKRLTAALVYIGLVRLETTIIQPFALGLATPVTYQRGRQQFAAAERFLRELSAQGSTGYATTAAQFLRRYPAAGLAIVISDFLSDTDCLQPLRELMARGHQLWLIQLSAPEDESPRERSHLRVIDIESRVMLPVSIDNRTIRAYEQAFLRHAGSLSKLARSGAGRYVNVRTTTPVAETLFGSMIAAGMVG